MSRTQLSSAESRLLLELLDKCVPGALSPEVFNALGRLVVYPAIELIPLRKNQFGDVEVLLISREASDPVWPSMLHMPGTVLRATDSSIEGAFKRLVRDELNGLKVSVLEFNGVHLNRNLRGNGLQMEYLVHIEGVPENAAYYSIDSLPTNFIQEQVESLNRGVERYRRVGQK